MPRVYFSYPLEVTFNLQRILAKEKKHESTGSGGIAVR